MKGDNVNPEHTIKDINLVYKAYLYAIEILHNEQGADQDP